MAAMPRSWRTSTVSARPARQAAGLFTVPRAAVPSTTKLGSSARNVLPSNCPARLDWAAGSMNPPEPRCAAAELPNTPATTMNTAAAARTGHG